MAANTNAAREARDPSTPTTTGAPGRTWTGCRTTTTGASEWALTCAETDPRKTAATVPRPRAPTTTVSALRTAVTVASALTNQKLVLEQITQLNTTTANIIDSTGKLLKDNTARIHEQAANATIPLETLQRATDRSDLDRLAALVVEHEVTEVVVGEPVHLSGASGASARDADAACLEIEELATQTPPPNVAVLMRAALQSLARK